MRSIFFLFVFTCHGKPDYSMSSFLDIDQEEKTKTITDQSSAKAQKQGNHIYNKNDRQNVKSLSKTSDSVKADTVYQSEIDSKSCSDINHTSISDEVSQINTSANMQQKILNFQQSKSPIRSHQSSIAQKQKPVYILNNRAAIDRSNQFAHNPNRSNAIIHQTIKNFSVWKFLDSIKHVLAPVSLIIGILLGSKELKSTYISTHQSFITQTTYNKTDYPYEKLLIDPDALKPIEDKMRAKHFPECQKLLFTGESNSGRWTLMKTLAAHYDIPVFVIECGQLTSTLHSGGIKNIHTLEQQLLSSVKKNVKTIILVDDIDILLTKTSYHNNNNETEHTLIALLTMFSKLKAYNKLIIATKVNNPNHYTQSKHLMEIFNQKTEFCLPNKDKIFAYIKSHLQEQLQMKQHMQQLEISCNELCTKIGNIFSYKMLDLVIADCIQKANECESEESEDIYNAIHDSLSINMKQIYLSLIENKYHDLLKNIRMKENSNIPLLQEIEEMQADTQALDNILGHEEQLETMKIGLQQDSNTATSGIRKFLLLYGKPGIGKSSMSLGLAKYYGAMTLNFKLPKDESNRLEYIENFFDAAKKLSALKTVYVLVDECSSLCADKTINKNEDIINLILTSLDELSNGKYNITLIFMTNYIDTFNSAFLDRMTTHHIQFTSDHILKIMKHYITQYYPSDAEDIQKIQYYNKNERNERKLQEDLQRKLQEENERKLQEDLQRKLQEENERKLQEDLQRNNELQEGNERKLQEDLQRNNELQEGNKQFMKNDIKDSQNSEKDITLLDRFNEIIDQLSQAPETSARAIIAALQICDRTQSSLYDYMKQLSTKI